MREFVPDRVFYEPDAADWPLGRELIDRYAGMGIGLTPIESHNSIPELRAQPESAFPRAKRHLVLGVRKSLSHRPNHKTSDFLVPWTSSGCTAMCLYCYLVCTYFTSAYLRVFVNREQMMAKLIRAAAKAPDAVFEIGSNSDLVLENAVSGSLEWTIRQFAAQPHGRRTRIRMSLNPEEVIRRVEFGTSGLEQRLSALNRLHRAGYPTGILIAPLILGEGWQGRYDALFRRMADDLEPGLLADSPLELIFMTYGYAHRQINPQAFPGAREPFDAELMAPCGRGRYGYRRPVKDEASAWLRERLSHYFPQSEVAYIV